MEKFKLELEARADVKPNQLRRVGKIPATLYGPGVASESVQVDAREFSRLPAGAYSHIVELKRTQGNTAALIRSVQRNHTNHQILHIEFYRVAADRKVTVSVPLRFTGASPAVQAGGVFQENYAAVEIECLPSDIPDNLTVDVSQILTVDTGVHFGQLQLPPGVKILNPHEEVVCRVVSVKASAADTAAASTAAAPAASSAS